MRRQNQPNQVMRHNWFESAVRCAVFMLTFIEILWADLNEIPGCTILEDDSLDIVVKCREFNESYTPDLLPSRTEYLQIYNVKNLSTHVPLAPKLTILTRLELPFNNIRNITKIMFQGLENLRQLSMVQNYIRSVPSDAFMNVPKLEILDLSENYLTSVESFVYALGNLKNLKFLYLSSNKLLRWIKDNDFVSLSNSPLAALDISNCLIEVIESTAFKPFKSLSSLNVSNNPLREEGLYNISFSLRKENLKELTVNQMKGMSYFSCRFLRWLQLTRIESLEISGNRFVCFPKGNRHLKSLTVNQCNILQLSPFSFSEMPNLEFLVLQEHYLTGIYQEFQSNLALKVLDLSHFAGKKNFASFEITDYAFENQKQLTYLKLWNLPIRTNIRRYTLYGLKNAYEVSFFKNYIPLIDCYAFETLSNLVHLDLSNNLIYELSNCSFYGLIKVRVINLSHNLLTFLNLAHPFDYTPKLEILHLDSNRIVKIPVDLFKKLNNIGLIILSNNIVQSWSNSFLPQISNSTILIMSENAITHFTEGMFEDLSSVELVDFSKNPINCSSCSIWKLKEWMKNNTSVIRSINKTEAYVCHNPETLPDISVVEANVTTTTFHCFPEEKNSRIILLIAVSVIMCVAAIVLVIWYKWSWNIKYRVFLLRLNAKKFKDQTDSKLFAFDAYVFHCEKDVGWIRNHLIPALEHGERQMRLCLPDRNFDAGISVLDNIISAIDNSRCTVVVLSQECLESSWCSYNIQMAQNMLLEKSRNGLIIILLENIDKGKLWKDLQYVLRTRTCIWWTENPVGQKLFWERLRVAIMRPTDRGISTHIT